jgi:hypothetical protein
MGPSNARSGTGKSSKIVRLVAPIADFTER